MKITFTEYAPSDAEYRDDTDYHFGGYLRFEAESLADTKRIIDYFKIHSGDEPDALLARANALSDPGFTYVHRPKKRPYYEVNGSLGVDLFQAYRDWAQRVFGFEGRFPDLKLSFPHAGLRHIYIGDSLQTEVGETVCYRVFRQSQPWNKMTAQEYAEKTITRYLREDFGHTEPVREFIDNGNGTYRRNPKYATGFRHPVTPALTNEGLCEAFAEWWLTHEANDRQRELLAANERLAERFGAHCRVNWMKDYRGFDVLDPDGSIDYDGKGTKVRLVTFEEFASGRVKP